MPESRIEVHHTLPCGCVLRTSILPHPNEEGSKWVLKLAEVAEFWLENRIARHQCELVSEVNPSGLAPAEKQPAAPTPQGE